MAATSRTISASTPGWSIAGVKSRGLGAASRPAPECQSTLHPLRILDRISYLRFPGTAEAADRRGRVHARDCQLPHRVFDGTQRLAGGWIFDDPNHARHRQLVADFNPRLTTDVNDD